ncbi:MAG: gliding motility lipoprotein GldH [Sphingobacteriales bacterium]|nr:gliding motility lipoprotein GldH [Sphingobacteriales bacterium]
MKNKPFIHLLFLCFGLIACEQKHFYNDYKSVDIRKWRSTDTLTYDIQIVESNHIYHYAVSVRHSKEYEFSNLWLKVLIKGSNGLDTSFRYEIPLFRNDGNPYGKTTGSLCTQTVPLRTSLPLSAKGNYTIQIIQLMRKDPIDGVSDIGVIIDQK